MSRVLASSLLGIALAACAPATGASAPAVDASGWTAGADEVEAGSSGSIGDLRRVIHYSRSAGTLSVEDSDPFAGGTEQHPARKLSRTLRLGPAERKSVEDVLAGVRPDAAALARRCAPGGCLWLSRDGDERLEDDANVRKVLIGLSRFFPELRQEY